MTVVRGFVITLSSAVAFAAAGGLAGFLLGRFAPDYYRAMFRMPPDLPLDLAKLGLGLGATQGFALGLLTGLVIVVSVAWYQSRANAVKERIVGAAN